MYEAVANCVTAIILGMAVGIVTSVILSPQYFLFTELPFKLTAPWGLITLIITFSFVVMIGGSYASTGVLKEKKIATILKGQ